MTSQTTYDVIIAGAGIVGLGTAYQLAESQPGIRLAIIEKEEKEAFHQSGHNSGVIHSGIYYQPGSLKAKNCLEGYLSLLDFAEKHDIPYDLCGKVIVATRKDELGQLDAIYNRGVAKGMEGLSKIGPEECKEIEPYTYCIQAIKVPQSGIIDYKKVAATFRSELEKAGADFYFNAQVTDVISTDSDVRVRAGNKEFRGAQFINCTGLFADKVTQFTRSHIDFQVIPFRGEYYVLKKESEYLVNGLIYPVPDPAFPFLGVHFTKMINGGVEAGPNAVLAYRREGYTNRDVNMSELLETLRFPGFRKLASKYWRTGLLEMKRSYSKKSFLQTLQRLIPSLTSDDIEKGGSGVRAQAVWRDGNLIDDFLIYQDDRVINVCNAPSPAATASLAIGAHIASLALENTRVRI